ncbi:MATE family efflux transporter [Collinsella aerofaciens]|uniref:MATE family efflux transporter n=1 Tax=Collinsella aerofaciens TaxID=74426 RepID=UPI00359CB8B8
MRSSITMFAPRGQELPRVTEGANDALIKRVFRSYVAITILITLSATLGMMLDTVLAGNFIGPDAVAAIGMASSLLILISGLAGVFSAGSMALVARARGMRDDEAVRVLFSVTVAASLAMGVVLSVAGVIAADGIADLFGAHTGVLHEDTAGFIRGLSFGSFAIVGTSVMMGLTRIDGAATLGLVAIVTMSVVDVAANLFAIVVLHAGTFGMGCATAFAYMVALAICCTHLLSSKCTLRFVSPFGHLHELVEVVNTGMPDSVMRFSTTARTFLFNRILMLVAGASAVTALSMLSSVSTFLSAVTVGVGETAVLLFSIFYGESDRASLTATARVALRMGLALCIVVCAAVFVCAEQVVAVFGLAGTDAFGYGVAAVRFFCLSVPVDLVLQVLGNFYRSCGNVAASNVIAFGQSVGGQAVIAAATMGILGVEGIWLSFPAGELLVLVLVMVWAASKRARAGEHGGGLVERSLAFPPGMEDGADCCASFFGCGDASMAPELSDCVGTWCREAGVDAKRSYLVALAVEEIAQNVATHGVGKGPAEVDVKVILRGDGALVLRIRDNGRAFNPLDYDLEAADACGCIGIKLLRAMLEDLEYQNVLGLNNTVATLKP